MSGRSGAWIIRAGLAVSLLPALCAACDLNPPEPSSGPQVQVSPHLLGISPSPSEAPPGIWVVSPLGLNVHQQPGTTAPVVGTASQGAALVVTHTRKVGDQTWLQVAAPDQSIAGWVLDEADLVIHREVNLHIDSDQSWSMLFPVAWTVAEPSAPAGTTTFSGDGNTLTVDVEAAAPHFTAPGTDLQDQQIEVYGVTTVLSTYRLQDGSYQLVSRIKWSRTQPVRYFTIAYHEPAATQPDASLCLQLIASIKIT